MFKLRYKRYSYKKEREKKDIFILKDLNFDRFEVTVFFNEMTVFI